jgi:hypothetical protein
MTLNNKSNRRRLSSPSRRVNSTPRPLQPSETIVSVAWPNAERAERERKEKQRQEGRKQRKFEKQRRKRLAAARREAGQLGRKEQARRNLTLLLDLLKTLPKPQDWRQQERVLLMVGALLKSADLAEWSKGAEAKKKRAAARDRERQAGRQPWRGPIVPVNKRAENCFFWERPLSSQEHRILNRVIRWSGLKPSDVSIECLYQMASGLWRYGFNEDPVERKRHRRGAPPNEWSWPGVVRYLDLGITAEVARQQEVSAVRAAAVRVRWSKTSAQRRTKLASLAAKSRWSKTSAKERTAFARRIIRARWDKVTRARWDKMDV